jgi:hypothetical protein
MEWTLAIGLGMAMALAAFWLAETLTDKAALVLLGPGFLLQELAGLGGHDEDGFLLLLLGNFAFYILLGILVLVLTKTVRNRKKSAQ